MAFSFSIFQDSWTFVLLTVVNITFFALLYYVHRQTEKVQNWSISNLSGYYVDFGKYVVHQHFSAHTKRRSFETISMEIKQYVLTSLGVRTVEEIAPSAIPEAARKELLLFLQDPIAWRRSFEQQVNDRSIQSLRQALLNKVDPYPKLIELLKKAKLVN